MTLRRNIAQQMHDGVPRDVVGSQRYYDERVGGQQGLLFYYPDPDMQGPHGSALPLYKTYCAQADGMMGTGSFDKVNTWWGTNDVVFSSAPQPFGDAVVRHTNSSFHGAGAACFTGTGNPPGYLLNWLPPHPHHYAIFLIVNPDVSGDTSSRNILSLVTTIGHKLRILHVQNTDFTYQQTGTSASSIVIGSRRRPDGWVRLVLVNSALGLSAGNVDWWVERELVLEGGDANANSLHNVIFPFIASDFSRKDTYAFDGEIAQVAMLYTGSSKIHETEIMRWFDDPWWFLHAGVAPFLRERCPYGELSVEPASEGVFSVVPASYGTIVIEAASDGALAIEPASSGECSIAPAAPAELAVPPASHDQMTIEPEADGVLSIVPAAVADFAIEPASDGEIRLEPAAFGNLSIEPAADATLSVCHGGP